MATLPTEIPPTLKEHATTAGLRAAIDEVQRLAAAQREAAGNVRDLRERTRGVIRADEEAYAAAVRRNPSVSEADVKRRLPEHDAELEAAARRSSALAQALDAARKDLNRQLRNARPAMTAALVKAIDDEVSAAMTTVDLVVGHIARVDELRGGLARLRGGNG